MTERKSQIIAAAAEQIKQDVAMGDLTAITQLLQSTNLGALLNYLPEDQQQAAPTPTGPLATMDEQTLFDEWDSLCAKANKALHGDCPLIEDQVLVEIHKRFGLLNRMNTSEMLGLEILQKIRTAVGDNGEMMQDELLEHIRQLVKNQAPNT